MRPGGGGGGGGGGGRREGREARGQGARRRGRKREGGEDEAARDKSLIIAQLQRLRKAGRRLSEGEARRRKLLGARCVGAAANSSLTVRSGGATINPGEVRVAGGLQALSEGFMRAGHLCSKVWRMHGAGGDDSGVGGGCGA